MKKVCVILVNWNGGCLTKDCIDSLLKGTTIPDTIVVVDNNSCDSSIELLTNSLGDRIYIIQNSENKGFAEANNQGIEYAINRGFDYIWLLNNDTIVDSMCLEELLAAIESTNNKKVAAVSALTFYEHDRNKVWYAGADRNPYSFAVQHRDRPIYEDLKTNFISGCCIFAKSETFKEYGGLIKEFIAYSEDDEWSLRLSQQGYYFMCISRAKLYHKVSASLKNNTGEYSRISDRALFLMNRNHLWVIRKYAPHKLVSVCVMLAICLKHIILSFYEPKRVAVYLKSCYHGLCDRIDFISTGA